METADRAFKLNLDETAKSEMMMEEELKEDDGDQSSSVKSQKKPIHHQNVPLSIDNDASEFFKRLNKPRKINHNKTQDDSHLGEEPPHLGLEEH